MKRALLSTLFVALLIGLMPRAILAEGGPERNEHRLVKLFPGGDVLQPGKRSSNGYTWYLGLDAGLTYSMFSDGPLNFYFNNRSPADVIAPVTSTVDDGDGIGLYLGATADFPVSDVVGIQFKLNYHTRVASFKHTQPLYNVEFIDLMTGFPEFFDIFLEDNVDWTFSYIGVEILARVQLMEQSLYLLIGPSFGFLSGNNAEVTQFMREPQDLYWLQYDEFNNLIHIDDQVRTLSADGEINGFESTRIDIKFGVGTWFELSEGLYITPELTVAYPITTFIQDSYASAPLLAFDPTTSEIFSRQIDYDSDIPVFQDSNTDFNMITIFFTVGLRWQMD